MCVLYGAGIGFISRATGSAVRVAKSLMDELSVLLLRVWAGSVGFLSGPHEAAVTGWAFSGPSVGEEATGSLGRWWNPGPWSQAGAVDSWPAGRLCAGPSLLPEALQSAQPAPSLQFPVLLPRGCERNRPIK